MITTSARCTATSAKALAPTRRCLSACTVTRPSMRCKADPDQAQRDNRANQLNPNNPNYQGGSTDYQGKGDKADLDNRANQKNPNNPNYPQQDNQQQQQQQQQKK